MARIYVTGFSCFGSVDANPTEELIQELTKRVQQPGIIYVNLFQTDLLVSIFI